MLKTKQGESNMRFRAHESFFIRKGWLYKGLKNVKDYPDIFTNKNIKATDDLGIGTNMVRSLRYWLQVAGLTTEGKTGINQRMEQNLTDLADIIWERDRYMEEIGTICLIHYKLATNKDKATAWYYFFNEFNLIEFDKKDFVTALSKYADINDEGVVESSYESDFDCLINTYISRVKLNSKKDDPESNIDCPIGELNLIDIVDSKRKIYKKSQPAKNMLHPLILLSIIVDNSKGEKEIRISSILNEAGNIGKLFNLDIISLTYYLDKLQQYGYVRVIRTAGLDVVHISTDMNFYDCISAYYDDINNNTLLK